MDNLQAMSLTQLDEDEIQSTEGGIMFTLVSLKLTADAIDWAYTEYKKGVADGYNNR